MWHWVHGSIRAAFPVHWGKCVGLALFILSSAPIATAATSAQLDDAIKRGKDYLYSTMHDGSWEQKSHVDPVSAQTPGIDMFSNDSTQWGMPTATAVLGLLEAGESPQDPRLHKAIEFLEKAEIHGTYPLGMRCQVWAHLHQTPEVKKAMLRDLRLLMSGALTGPNNAGLFDFTCPPLNPYLLNHEPAGYGLVALEGLAEAGCEVPNTFWSTTERTWRAHQRPDGGWSYVGGADSQDASVESASGAGVIALFITDEFLRGDVGISCSGNFRDEAREKGLQFVGNLQLNEQTEIHWLWMLERIASASALRQFGKMDWFATMSDLLVKTQADDGSWTDIIANRQQWSDKIVGTGYCLSILASSRAPLMAAKLEYTGVSDQPAPTKGANWNQRPRDIANLTQWVSRQTERPLNWQVTNLSGPATDLLDSPILYISGNQAIAFNAEETAKLKWYVLHGGMIVGNADCGNAKFATAFRKLGKELFPEHEFRSLSADHTLFKDQQFPLKTGNTRLKIEGMSNGIRELILLFGDADPAKAWQLKQSSAREDSFKVMSDLFQYAAGTTNVHNKGDSYYVAADSGVQAKKNIGLARIQFKGNWDPEPGAWEQLGNVLHNTQKATLHVDAVDPAAGPIDLQKFKVAHLVATDAFTLDKPAREQIVAFVHKGGTLVLEAGGGSPAAAASIQTELQAMFNSTAEPLPMTDAIFAAPVKIDGLHFRRAAVTAGISKENAIKVIKVDGRPAVYFAGADLSLGLVGQSSDSIVGLTPPTATALMANILLR